MSEDDTEREQLTETIGNPHIESGPREAVNHPGIDGTWHRYGALEWWDPENLYDDDYARPICPVSECATGESHECRIICERVDVDRGINDQFIDVEGRVGGGWFCGMHGWFRVFDYPRESEPETTQQTLIADGGRVEDGTEHDKVSPLDDGNEFDRPLCPISDCRFILEAESPKGFAELADHEWHCPNHGSLLVDAETVQRRCSHCGELADPLPEEYHGEYVTPDGETYYAHSGDHMHPECADEVIEALENGRSPVTLGDFA